MPDDARVIATSLKALAFTHVREADDGRSALPLLKLERFDLLIADAYMPSMSGIELLRAVRTDRELSALPVLMVTIESRPQFVAAAVGAGVGGYMVKPFRTRSLEHRITQIFGRLAATASTARPLTATGRVPGLPNPVRAQKTGQSADKRRKGPPVAGRSG